jgi:hypothetical protein
METLFCHCEPWKSERPASPHLMSFVGLGPGMLWLVDLFPHQLIAYLAIQHINHVVLCVVDWAHVQFIFFENGGSEEILDELEPDLDAFLLPTLRGHFDETQDVMLEIGSLYSAAQTQYVML